MVDLNVNSTEVTIVGSVPTFERVAGVAINPGQAVYEDANGTWSLASATSQAESQVMGIALSIAAQGQVLRAAAGGAVTLGATAAPVPGQWYLVSGNAGMLMPVADLTSGQWSALVGVGSADNVLQLLPFASQQQLP